MSSKLFFMECLNENCRFRFPLDLDSFKGKICPQCGSELRKATERLAQWRPGGFQSDHLEFIILLDNIRSAHNVGSIFRTCEGADVNKVILCGLTPTPQNNRSVIKAALGAENRLDWEWAANSLQMTAALKAEGYKVVILECLPEALNLFEVKPESLSGDKLLVLLGSEPAGVDPGLLDLADSCIYIPMAGEKSSLNVSVAFGIAVYELRNILRER